LGISTVKTEEFCQGNNAIGKALIKEQFPRKEWKRWELGCIMHIGWSNRQLGQKLMKK
jgi:hypothetical protein